MPADAVAIESLYRAHHGWLRGWLTHRLACSEKAADLAQDTFLRLLTRRCASLGEAPRALLVTIAKGLVVDHWRRSALEVAYRETLAALPEDQTPSPEVQLEALDLLERLAALLDGLEPMTREAFLLRQLGGLRYAAIATQLGVSTRSVERHVREALYHCYRLRFADA
ncbi:sigma-70 family RNA polymerase sigma factor [Salinicola rhizosphaerae]|uniref:ECF sigma factor FoxI n=1 Tax=Salinicola rhizosphaerae TaxID=1443141 RepID=A0ABQ3DWH1_9GAMM|nr:sigma-70 family RNA polymerase sigma factor [Salinicola rhizosphaerae]GHB18464.1 ECF sigma factor FoxI [Salinicola rhizosphaerae]